MFVVFLLVFTVTRLIMFPYICWSAHFEAALVVGRNPNNWAEWISISLLYVLLAIQIFWGYLIMRVLYKMIKKGNATDDRSDDEESDIECEKFD